MKSENLIIGRVKIKMWPIEVTMPVYYKSSAVRLAQVYYHFEVNVISSVYYAKALC